MAHSHAIKLANAAIDDIRRRVQHQQLSHRGRKCDPLYRARRVFLTGFDRLTDDRIAWMFDMPAPGPLQRSRRRHQGRGEGCRKA